MDKKAMYQLTYGLFVLTAKEDNFFNGCIINTALQVTTTPNRIAITVNKANKTHDMVLKTGVFNICTLTQDTPFSVFKQFGFQSGSNVDKFADFAGKAVSENGLYYLSEYANSYLSGKVVSTIDLGTHTMFIADVTDGVVLSEAESVSYAYYQKNIKPAPETAKKGTRYVCKVCGYVYEGEVLPPDFICPICKHGAEDFERIEG